MPESQNGECDYDISNVKNIEPEYAENILEGYRGCEIVSCKPVPGAETMPPDKINIAPHRTVRVYELADDRSEGFILVMCLLRGGDGPGGILIDKAFLFDGEVLDMLDYLLKKVDEADWSRGLKEIINIKTTDDYDYVAKFLEEVSHVLEEQEEDRYAMDLWEEYIKNTDDVSLPEGLPV